MNPIVVMLLIALVVAAFGLGWIVRSFRVNSSVRAILDAMPAGAGRAKYSEKIINRQIVELTCNCGEVTRFRSSSVSNPADLPVLPSTDSYTCPKCGFTMDLKRLRDIAQKLPDSF